MKIVPCVLCLPDLWQPGLFFLCTSIGRHVLCCKPRQIQTSSNAMMQSVRCHPASRAGGIASAVTEEHAILNMHLMRSCSAFGSHSRQCFGSTCRIHDACRYLSDRRTYDCQDAASCICQRDHKAPCTLLRICPSSLLC